MSTALASFVEKFTSKYNNDSDSIYHAKVHIDQTQIEKEIQNLINVYNLFDDKLEHEDSERSAHEIAIEQKIQKYSVKNLFKKLQNVTSEEELKALTTEYEKAFEEITPISAIKSKRHMKEYVAMFAALRSLQQLMDKQFESKDLAKEFENNFKQQLKNINQQRLKNARTNNIPQAQRNNSLSSMLISSFSKTKNVFKDISGNIAFIITNTIGPTKLFSFQKIGNAGENRLLQANNNINELSKGEYNKDSQVKDQKKVAESKTSSSKVESITSMPDLKEIKRPQDSKLTKISDRYAYILNSNSNLKSDQNVDTKSFQDKVSSAEFEIDCDDCRNGKNNLGRS
ncbi:MAG: hypothetical protein ACK4OM_06740 [Alphaproteobacteria bacterium]